MWLTRLCASLGLPSWEDWGDTRDAARLGLEEPQQLPRAVQLAVGDPASAGGLD